MNNKIILTALALVATMAVQAQSDVKPTQSVTTNAQRVNERSLALAKELGLDQTQTDRMLKADMHYAEQMEAIRTKTTDRETLESKTKGLTKEHEATLKVIFSPEQYAKYNEMRVAKSAEGQQKMEQMQTKPTE
jgi:protein CpxP